MVSYDLNFGSYPNALCELGIGLKALETSRRKLKGICIGSPGSKVSDMNTLLDS